LIRFKKGFTLIELLVVVAIIGILAAVGVVAFNGFTTSAKKSAVLAHHNAFVKQITFVVQQCNIQGFVLLKKNSPSGTKLDPSVHKVSCYEAEKWDWFQYVRHDMMNNGFKNPYSDDSNTSSAKGVDAISNFSWMATCSNSYDDQNLGKVMIMTMNSMNHIHVCTCIEMPCTNVSNRLEVKIYYN